MKKIALAILGLSCASTFACTTIIVGKNASADGSILVGRNVDAGHGNHPVHYIKHAARSDAFTFQSVENKFTYAMPAGSMAYTGMPDFDGKNQSYEEQGFNSAGVTMSATETIFSSDAALKADPYVDNTGITESEVTSILLPQIKSARQGVEMLGKIIETQGAGEGFGIAFADQNEVWYLENAGGHRWVAVRIPDDMYFVSANQGRIREVDLKDTQNVMGSKDLVDFAVQHGLATARADGKIDFFAAYTANVKSDAFYNYNRVWTLQNMYTPSFKSTSYVDGVAPVFMKPDHKLSLNDVEAGLQNYYQGTANDPYSTLNAKPTYRPISVFRAQQSHVLATRTGLPMSIANVQYQELGMAALGIYVPFYQGSQIPAEYGMGTDKADSQSAWWKFHKLQALVMQNFPKYAPAVQAGYAQLNADIQKQQAAFEQSYVKVYASNKKKAQKMLDDFTKSVVDQVDQETELLTNGVFTQLSIDVNNQYYFHGA